MKPEVTITVEQPGDREPILTLMREASLPLDGIEVHGARFLVARRDGRPVGCIAFELHGTACVLRSLAVEPAERGAGIGRGLVNAILAAARDAGARDAYGLTATAGRMMAHMGFRVIARSEVPDTVRASTEFHIPACSTAEAIHRRI